MVKSLYNVVGLMSGTSLDGLDIAHCSFSVRDGKWTFSVNHAETVEYSREWKERLLRSMKMGGEELALLNVDLGKYFGTCVRNFLDGISIPTSFISSHGHTVFHQPALGLTLQIASPAHIAAMTGMPVVADFRTTDVALGGNGAPLVPVGDQLLFGQYQACLNLGGIANISYSDGNERHAFDVCPFNMVFDYLAARLELPFDDGGRVAAGGSLHKDLLEELNDLDYYHRSGPRSLGREWVEKNVFPLLQGNIPVNVLMHTYCHHALFQIRSALPADASRILVTGGGAFHRFFIDMLAGSCRDKVIEVPPADLIRFKEALVFAFLGVLRWRNEVNCLKSVTGATTDSCGGAIYLAS